MKRARTRRRQLEWPSTLPASWAGDLMMHTLDRRMSSTLASVSAPPGPPPPPSSVRTRTTVAPAVAAKRNRRAR